MPRRKTMPPPRTSSDHKKPISLKRLAEHLGLSSATVSIVINRKPLSDMIPEETKTRIWEAASRFNYRPNIIARSLRQQRTYSIGVLLPEFSDGYSALVLSGIEDYLLGKGYAWLAASHRHKDELIREYPHLLYTRAVEGLITIDTPYDEHLPFPVVSVSGHQTIEGVTNIVLNHDRSAELAIGHLHELGHRRIAFIKGQSFSSDTQVRWDSIRKACRSFGITVDPQLVAQLEGVSPSPEPGYQAAKRILANKVDFTALFSFNDVSAIGAIRALQEADLHVPESVSVVGFDDIAVAAYHIPALTTIRQPLGHMGSLAAETLVERIAARGNEGPALLEVEPELVVRESTAPLSTAKAVPSGKG
ncbi:transcriptional regulator, LacI family [Candidatus Koribacter versatilis Ellin345]|uniref:Transcriptional regulator, LacI family n=2 Tax=Candidatus Korobacter versatilis TaxID=658062 RepID=Q1IUB2_KORVE|nr:transcriptional regulator, LacI family [Candidatus Koribacter versatilis Ellin345]